MERSSDTSNFQIDVMNLIEDARKFVKVSDLTNAEYFINLALLSPDLEFIPKIQSFAIRSFINFSKNNEFTVLLISVKFLKELSKVNFDLESELVYSFVRVLYRAGSLLAKNKNFFLSSFFYYKAKNFLESNDSLKNDNECKRMIETNFKESLDHISINLREEKEKYFAELQIQNGTIEKLRNLFLSGNYSFDTNSESVYLVSTQWMNNLIHFLKNDINSLDKIFERKNVCLLYFNNGSHRDEYKRYLGNYPGPINNYHIIELKDFWYDPLKEENYTNTFLKKDAKENSDFIYLDEGVYDLMRDYFEVQFGIERKLNKNMKYKNSGKYMFIKEEPSREDVQIEIHLKRIKILVLSNFLINEANKYLIRPRYIQISKSNSLYDLKLKILRCLEYEIKKDLVDLKNLEIRMVIPEISLKNKKKEIFQIVYSYTNKFVQFKIKGEEIKDDNLLIQDLKIAAKDLVIVEIKYDKDPRKNWFINLIKEKEENEIICSHCEILIKINAVPCDYCYDYLYCSSACKNQDEHHIRYHQNLSKLFKKKIELSDIVSIDIDELISKNSRGALTGLKNLGNTCFMNSALQCLSNSEELTKYFLLKKFVEEINKKNKYGSGGQIAQAYHNLIKELWLGTNTYLSPWDFRQIFVGFVKQFAGFSQHDSHEMLAYMLDALHEDLNRVKDKPYFELKEKLSNETDEEASKRWWNSHLSRENSIIVDLFHGQYKSTITCPECNRISITYDAFMHLGLPIPVGQCKARVKFFPLPSDSYKVYQVDVKINENTSIKDIKSAIQKFYSFNLINDYQIDVNDNKNLGNLYLEAIVTSEKEFKKILPDNDSNNHVLHSYENNNEIIVYQTELPTHNRDVITFYALPVEIVEEKSFFMIRNKKIQPLFYVCPFSFNSDSTFYDLYISIFRYYRKIFKNINQDKTYEKFLTNYDNVKEEFKLYFGKDETIPFKIYVVNNIADNNPCEFCGKSCERCPLNFNLKSKLGLINDLLRKKRPILLNVELLSYNGKRLVDDLDIKISGKNIFSHSANLNIYDCLDAFRKEERLEKENSWYCSACKQHQEAFKKLEIFTPPNLLIIQLKRFKIKTTNVLLGAFANKKNDSLIHFPLDNLDLRKYVISDRNKNDAIYELYAVSQHYGGLTSGHYTAVCKNRNRWHSFDDESVSRCSQENVVTSAAYLLFYKKKSLNQSVLNK